MLCMLHNKQVGDKVLDTDFVSESRSMGCRAVKVTTLDLPNGQRGVDTPVSRAKMEDSRNTLW